MNENLNLVEILKDCPRGTKLYSTIYGEVELDEITSNPEYPIIFKFYHNDGSYGKDNATIDGKHSISVNGECTLFPSKDQRDWTKFKVESELIDGEFYYCCYSYNLKENSFIFIYKKHFLYKTKCYAAINILHSILFKESLITNNNEIIIELRKATEEEKQRLLNAIKREGYKWNEEKKELIEPKFNISTFQPFDKVLCRIGNQKWICDFFGHIENDYYKFVCIGDCYTKCIPYNEETKHLVGTTKMPPEKYINWEE